MPCIGPYDGEAISHTEGHSSTLGLFGEVVGQLDAHGRQVGESLQAGQHPSGDAAPQFEQPAAAHQSRTLGILRGRCPERGDQAG